MRIINFIVTLNKLFAINTWKHRPTYSRDNGTNCPVKLRFKLISAFTNITLLCLSFYEDEREDCGGLLCGKYLVACYRIQEKHWIFSSTDFIKHWINTQWHSWPIVLLIVCIVISDGGSWVTAVPLLAAIHGQQLSSNNNRHRYMTLCCTVLYCTVLYCNVVGQHP